MKTLDIGQADINSCVSTAQTEPVVVMRGGEPVALIVGVAGMDEEQIELGTSPEFWRMIQQRREQRTISQSELDSRLAAQAKHP
jgi:hypothetical protein